MGKAADLLALSWERRRRRSELDEAVRAVAKANGDLPQRVEELRAAMAHYEQLPPLVAKEESNGRRN
jgi:hypothetical protein